MLEFKEFMIGDWIYKDDKPHRFEVKDYEGDSNFSWKAVPITIDFLKNNGFVEEDIKETQDINDIHYVLYGDWGRLIYVPGWKAFYVISPSSSEEWFNICATAKYVHEIQHMIRFAKLNDIADNLKID